MPGYIGIQLALELSNVLPIKELATSAATRLINIARDLRNSGSDIVVENDLTDVFGRGQISMELERGFKGKVQISSFTPLYHGSEIELHSGPGPTVLQAFQESRFLATVITLSLLSYFHGREDLARMLASSMAARFENKLPGANSPPGYEGIANTLTACATQCGMFHWAPYRVEIEQKLRSSMPDYIWNPDYSRITPAVLLGAMDFFYIVKSLPEDRIITVSSQRGFITLTIWAHILLGLNVVLTNLSGPDIVFGDAKERHIIIHWHQNNSEEAKELFWPNESEDPGPEIRLHDKEMTVILSSVPDEHEADYMQTVERHPLKGYGTTYLRRILNVDIVTNDNDPIYSEIVCFVTGYALDASQRMGRNLKSAESSPSQYLDESIDAATMPAIQLEKWRVMNSAKLLFDGFTIDPDNCSKYAGILREHSLCEASLPLTFDTFLSKVSQGTSSFSTAKRLIDHIEHLTKLVIVFAHIVELEQCGDMPLILTNELVQLSTFIKQIRAKQGPIGLIESYEVFHAISNLLSFRFDSRDDTKKWSSRGAHFLYLCSDFGWSVYLNTVGDYDPADVRPELVHVRKGTPTNPKTKERKLRIRDGVGFRRSEYPDVYPVDRGLEYVPRTFARLTAKKEYWTSQLQEFELTLYLTFESSPEWQKHGGIKTLDEVTGYRKMLDTLWGTYYTPDCEHKTQNSQILQKIRLGSDAVALLGSSTAIEILKPFPERFIILLTKGDRHLRWTAIESASYRGYPKDRQRNTMLRTNKCCESCALSHVASQHGRWILIL